MTLEITLDHESEHVTIVMDNHLVLSAYIDASNHIVYSRNFAKIAEDDLYKSTRKICEVLLMGTNENNKLSS